MRGYMRERWGGGWKGEGEEGECERDNDWLFPARTSPGPGIGPTIKVWALGQGQTWTLQSTNQHSNH